MVPLKLVSNATHNLYRESSIYHRFPIFYSFELYILKRKSVKLSTSARKIARTRKYEEIINYLETEDQHGLKSLIRHNLWLSVSWKEETPNAMKSRSLLFDSRMTGLHYNEKRSQTRISLLFSNIFRIFKCRML